MNQYIIYSTIRQKNSKNFSSERKCRIGMEFGPWATFNSTFLSTEPWSLVELLKVFLLYGDRGKF